MGTGEQRAGAFTAALIHLRQTIPALTANQWWEEGDGNVVWLNKEAQPLSAQEWQSGMRHACKSCFRNAGLSR
jgi:glycogen operon protein